MMACNRFDLATDGLGIFGKKGFNGMTVLLSIKIEVR